MKRTLAISLTLVLALAGVVYATERSDGPPGDIALLDGYVHTRLRGIDTQVGEFIRNGSATIRYDIGELAGVYAKRGRLDEFLWYKEQVVAGQKLNCALTKDKRLLLSFPESHANFIAEVKSESDIADVFLIVLTYRGKGSR